MKVAMTCLRFRLLCRKPSTFRRDSSNHICALLFAAQCDTHMADFSIEIHMRSRSLSIPLCEESFLIIMGLYARSYGQEKCLLTSSCPSVCPHVSARLQREEFLLNLTLGGFYENMSRNSKFG
jgi:hypothetical protein